MNDQPKSLYVEDSKKQDSIILKIMDFFKFIYLKNDIDYAKLRLIIQTKLIIDERQPDLVGQNQSAKKDGNSFFRSLGAYLLMSCFTVIFLFIGNSWILQYATYFGYLFFMLLSTLIASFSTILLDTRDYELLGTKPISTKTLSAAKTTHVLIYLLAFTLVLGGPVTIVTYFINGIAAGLLVTILTIIFCFWTLLFTLGIYSVVLMKFDGEKLKNIISYTQIGLSIFMVIGYQLINQIVDVVDIFVVYAPQLWHLFLFPIWFAAPLGMVQEGATSYYIVYTILMIGLSLVMAVFYQKNAGKMEENILRMSESSEGSSIKTSPWLTISKKLICQRPEELPYYHFAWKTIQHEREFKTRIYPSLLTSFILPVILIFNSFTDGFDLAELREMDLAYYLYFTLLMAPELVASMKFSTYYKGAWAFQLSPKSHKPYFVMAAGKAVWMRILCPLFLAAGAIFLFLFGWDALSVILNAFLALTSSFFLYLTATMKYYPFSQERSAPNNTEGCFTSILFVVMAGIVGLVNFALDNYIPYGGWIMTAVLLIITLKLLFFSFKQK
ncbi:hypothetical protein JTF06_14070 [Desemzia sp. RIT804]|uniref:hypothetical protein n=1 Tax=Desemzia sp. RIT 804 TaxID=2810209 RepID=UPI00194DC426|nr:hypothetical protein [Desemzia sp. RIT 804]MBM6616014.1 hypothetical protein [Desemzia sp. RIT 804]